MDRHACATHRLYPYHHPYHHPYLPTSPPPPPTHTHHHHHHHHPYHHPRFKQVSPFCFSVVARMFAPSVGTMVDGEHAFATRGGTPWRRRQRRLRAFRRYVLWHSKMEIAAALHNPPVFAHLRPRNSPALQWSLLRLVSLILFLLLKSLLRLCTTKSIRNSFLQVRRL